MIVKMSHFSSQVAGIFEEKGCSVSTYHERMVEVDGELLAAEVMEIIVTQVPTSTTGVS